MLEIKFILAIFILSILVGCSNRIEVVNGPLVDLESDLESNIAENVFPSGSIDGIEIQLKKYKGYKFLSLQKLNDSSAIVGVLCWAVEDPGEYLPIIMSNDSGKTWKQVSCIVKDHYLDEFEYSKFRSSGEAIVVLSQDQGIFGIDDAPRKVFVFRTNSYINKWNKYAVPYK